jgi:hypothetical protein
MTDYLEKYREALRDGDEEKANEFYEKYKGTAEEENVEEDDAEETSSEFDPSDHTVAEVKDEVEDYSEEEVEEVLELELGGKERTTLVEYLEEKLG